MEDNTTNTTQVIESMLRPAYADGKSSSKFKSLKDKLMPKCKCGKDCSCKKKK